MVVLHVEQAIYGIYKILCFPFISHFIEYNIENIFVVKPRPRPTTE
jgi:hypothetical protein